MDVASLIQSLSKFGDLGLIIAFLIWWNVRCDKQRTDAARTLAEERKVEDEKRFNYDKDRLATDRELAGSFAALTAAIQALQMRDRR